MPRSSASGDHLRLCFPGLLGGVLEDISQILSCLGSDVGELSSCFFRGINLWLPFISRDRYYRSLSRLEITLEVDSAVLVMAVCLLGRSGPQSGHEIDQASLFSAIKVLVAKALVARPSQEWIQSHILIAVFEYGNGRADHAFNTLTTAIRLAYSFGLDQKQSEPGEHSTWWMLMICER